MQIVKSSLLCRRNANNSDEAETIVVVEEELRGIQGCPDQLYNKTICLPKRHLNVAMTFWP